MVSWAQPPAHGLVLGLVLAVCAATALLPADISGQRPPTGERRGSQIERERLEQRIRARFARVIKSELGLGDEDAATLSEITASFRTRRAALAREERRVRAQTDSVLASGDDGRASRLLVRLGDLMQREAELLREEQERLLEIITPIQVLRYLVLREELGARIRGLGRRPPGQGVDAMLLKGHT